MRWYRPLLVVLIVATVAWARSQGQTTACKSNLKNLATALEMYSSDWQGSFPASLDQLTPDYLKSIPTCPMAGSDTYTASYRMARNPDRYGFCCLGGQHAGYPSSYPAYLWNVGLINQPHPVDLEQCRRNILSIAESMGNDPQGPAPTCAEQTYLVSRAEDYFIVECSSGSHFHQGVAALHPRYDSRLSGLEPDVIPIFPEQPPIRTWPMIWREIAPKLILALLLLVGLGRLLKQRSDRRSSGGTTIQSE